jgi:hypothetical protein
MRYSNRKCLIYVCLDLVLGILRTVHYRPWFKCIAMIDRQFYRVYKEPRKGPSLHINGSGMQYTLPRAFNNLIDDLSKSYFKLFSTDLI